jgi:hypothetical protein
VPDDRKRNRGLIFDPKRFNVATTRAKELMICIGHMETLFGDPYWRSLINFAVRRGCFRGPKSENIEQDDGVDGGISRLEEAYISSVDDRGTDSPDADTQNVLASSVARLAMDG